MSAAPPPKHRWRNRFTLVVFAAVGVSGLLQWLDPPDEPEAFRPPDEVEIEPLELPPGPHVALGRVLDDTGNAAGDALVQVLAGGRPQWTYTDAEGTFALTDLPGGKHAAVVLAEGHLPAEFTLEVPQRAEAAWRLPLRQDPIDYLEPVARTDRPGRLLPSIGSSVERCEVVFEPAEDTPPYRGTTMRRVSAGADGAFLVEALVHGIYRVTVLPSWAAGGSGPVLATFRYEHGADPVDLNVPLESGKLRGDLRDDRGRPVGAALVLVRAYEDENALWPPATSDDDGSFEVTDLPAGRYRVEVRSGRHASNSLIEVPVGTAVELELGPIRTD